MTQHLSESPKSTSFDYIDNMKYKEKEYEKAIPVILNEPQPDMEFIRDTIIVYQYPPDDKMFVPTYISGDYQTHYAIYRLVDGKLDLEFEYMQIIFDGVVSYYIQRTLKNVLYKLGLNRKEVDQAFKNKYFLK